MVLRYAEDREAVELRKAMTGERSGLAHRTWIEENHALADPVERLGFA